MIINGGITSLEEVQAHLRQVDGVMLGRAAYQDPYVLAGVNGPIYRRRRTPPSRLEVLDSFMPYVAAELPRARAPQSDDAAYPRAVHRQPRARTSAGFWPSGHHVDGAGIEVLQAARRIIAGESHAAIAAEWKSCLTDQLV